MNLQLPPSAAAFVEDQLRSGAYSSAEEVVVTALETLRADTALGDFSPGEIDRLLEAGERSGDELGWHSREDAQRELQTRLQHRRDAGT